MRELEDELLAEPRKQATRGDVVLRSGTQAESVAGMDFAGLLSTLLHNQDPESVPSGTPVRTAPPSCGPRPFGHQTKRVST